MRMLTAIFMTLFMATLVVSTAVLADVINQENLKTHLRWNLVVPRDQFFIVKRDQSLIIETVNLDLYEALSKEMGQLKNNSQYVDSISYSRADFPSKPASITVQLKDPSVELFSFYRDTDKKYILDFWINTDLVSDKASALQKPLPLPKTKKVVEAPKTKNDLLVKKSAILPAVEVKKEVNTASKVNPEFRDYRYGASFVWDYPAMIPQLEKDINLQSKLPDYIYPIKDRDNLVDQKEAHLQLSINFYKEEKWGLMNKSITLYEKKYGRDSNHIMNEFLKANALLKGNLAKPNRGITQTAMGILSNLKDMTKEYELKAAILRYLIQHSVDGKDYVKTLELSKELYVEARAEFDHTLVIQSSLTILHSLAELKQVEKIEAFLGENKKLESMLPPQMNLAYSSFGLLSKDETGELIKRYKSVEKSLIKPVHPAILYNYAESLFRVGEFESSVKVYNEFLSSYSYLIQAPYARLRVATVNELLEKPAAETLALYKNAIDRSTSPEIRYEAKLRYVGLNISRRLNVTAMEQETEVFLEQSPDESKALNLNLKKLLWLTRLRVFISTKDYNKALAYLTSLPLDSLKPADRRVFEGDGAEVVYGLVQDAYYKEEYSKVVKIWEVYKEKYETKVARNLYMNFAVCDSFLKLGLYKSYDRALDTFRTVQSEVPRTFPIWVERVKTIDLAQMIEELSLIRLIADSNWTAAEAKLATYPVSLRDSINYPFYRGLIEFKQKNYSEAVIEFEKVLVTQNPKNQLTPRQTADLLMGYVEGLYQLKDQERFKTIVRALNNDIRQSKSAPILNISERINYLLIETFAGSLKPEWKEIETMTKEFREKFQKSPYTARIGYLYGLSLIKNSKVPEGREVFSELTNDKTVPSHIKEMCRSELATLELREKNYN